MKNIFFVGINGIGMSGLAQIMNSLDYNVSGSDLSHSYLSEKMIKQGINVFSSHSEENIKNIDTLIVSTAIGINNPEYREATRQGIPIIKRGELLAKLLNTKTGVAVAGTHGKTTTSSMLSSILLDKDPTVVVGGVVPAIGSNAKFGTSDYFIAEADESDNSFLFMKPKYSIITNIEEDHLENHGSLDNIKKSFESFAKQTEEEVLLCIDCPNTDKIIKSNKHITSYSLQDKNANLYGNNIRIEDKKTYFDFYMNNEFIGEFVLSIPGKHNVSNALPVIYLGLKFGLSPDRIKENLILFTGAKRRYDILLDSPNYKIIDDYGHHPTEIIATLQGAKSIEDKKITVIFQPHRYSRTNFLLEQFSGAFDDAHELILMPVYSAGEKDEFGLTLDNFLKKINHNNSKIISTEEDILSNVHSSEEPRVYIFMGAGNISSIANSIAQKLK